MSGNQVTAVGTLIEGFRALSRQVDGEHAIRWLAQQLAARPLEAFIDCTRRLVDQQEAQTAIAVLEAAVLEYPQRPDLRYLLGSIKRQAGDVVGAESAFRTLLSLHPAHKDVAFNLAGMLRENGRLSAACAVISSWAGHLLADDLDSVLQATIFLRQSQRVAAAAELCEKAIAKGAKDHRLLYLAGELALSLGDFKEARERMEQALAQGIDPNQWFAFQAMADCQRYERDDHPDFDLFRDQLADRRLQGRGRASVLFALGKAMDDVARFQDATRCWREANDIIRAERAAWPAEAWTRKVRESLESAPVTIGIEPIEDFVPVFIVGMPRSGTTLVSELLGRHAGVRNRGELNWINFIDERLTQTNTRNHAVPLHEAARLYYAHVRQDDPPVRFYVDKNPMNFRHLGLIATLFPNARIIHCRRDARDTALSIWSRFFAAGENEFAYDFESIGKVMADCRRMMEHWQRTLPLPIFEVVYEELVDHPEPIMERLRQFLSMSAQEAMVSSAEAGRGAIGTSSLWQARQPIYRESVGRALHYSEFLPELDRVAAEASRV